MASSTSRRFGTILSGRSNQAPPTELEIELRKHCDCLRVVSRGLNGANLVLPPASSGEATLAVRVYYEADLPPGKATSVETLTSTTDDIEELLHFQQSFALTLVFFVLTDEEKDVHLNHMGSFVRRAMHRLTTSSLSTSLPNNTTRIMIVPSSEAAVEALVHFADSLKPAKRQLKQAFYDQRRRVHFLPPTTPETEPTAASYVITALYEWSQSNEIPDRDMDIVVQFCGSLESIVALSATGLAGAPISQRTKDLLQQFFHGDGDELIPQPRSFEELPGSYGNYALHDGPLPSSGMYQQPPMHGQTTNMEKYMPQQHQQSSFGQSEWFNQGWMEEPPNAMAAAHSIPSLAMNQGHAWFYPAENSAVPLTRQNQVYRDAHQQHEQPNYPTHSHPYHSGLNQQRPQPQQRMYPTQGMYPSIQMQQHYPYSPQQQQQQQQQPLYRYPPTQCPPRLYR
eukprot:scaffold5215_cov181-Amphora_coffeaeformis.AAC.12